MILLNFVQPLPVICNLSIMFNAKIAIYCYCAKEMTHNFA